MEIFLTHVRTRKKTKKNHQDRKYASHSEPTHGPKWRAPNITQKREQAGKNYTNREGENSSTRKIRKEKFW